MCICICVCVSHAYANAFMYGCMNAWMGCALARKLVRMRVCMFMYTCA